MLSFDDLLEMITCPVTKTALELLTEQVQKVKEETIRFIANQLTLDSNKAPTLPIFFVKAYNVLRIRSIEEDIKCLALDTLPYDVLCFIVNSYGPIENFPREVEYGLLEEEEEDCDDLYEVFEDIVQYISNYCEVHDEIPDFPISFQVARKAFEWLFDTEMFLVEGEVPKLGEVLQSHLESRLVGYLLPEDYVPAH